MEQATLSGAVFRTYEELQADPASSPSPPTPPTVVAHDLLQTISERGQGALEESEILLTQVRLQLLSAPAVPNYLASSSQLLVLFSTVGLPFNCPAVR